MNQAELFAINNAKVSEFKALKRAFTAEIRDAQSSLTVVEFKGFKIHRKEQFRTDTRVCMSQLQAAIDSFWASAPIIECEASEVQIGDVAVTKGCCTKMSLDSNYCFFSQRGPAVVLSIQNYPEAWPGGIEASIKSVLTNKKFSLSLSSEAFAGWTKADKDGFSNKIWRKIQVHRP